MILAGHFLMILVPTCLYFGPQVGHLKVDCTQHFLNITLKRLPRGPKRAQERPKSGPRVPKSGPRAAQEQPKSRPRAPKSAQERPKSAPRAPKNRPRAPQDAPESFRGTTSRLGCSEKPDFEGDPSRDSVDKRVRQDFRWFFVLCAQTPTHEKPLVLTGFSAVASSWSDLHDR